MKSLQWCASCAGHANPSLVSPPPLSVASQSTCFLLPEALDFLDHVSDLLKQVASWFSRYVIAGAEPLDRSRGSLLMLRVCLLNLLQGGQPGNGFSRLLLCDA